MIQISKERLLEYTERIVCLTYDRLEEKITADELKAGLLLAFNAATYDASDYPQTEKCKGLLAVGINNQREVIINLPHDMTGHIVFSVSQARSLADSLNRKADEAEDDPLVIERKE